MLVYRGTSPYPSLNLEKRGIFTVTQEVKPTLAFNRMRTEFITLFFIGRKTKTAESVFGRILLANTHFHPFLAKSDQ